MLGLGNACAIIFSIERFNVGALSAARVISKFVQLNLIYFKLRIFFFYKRRSVFFAGYFM